jgi:drug/metabolite transporter (DMT)-like permease
VTQSPGEPDNRLKLPHRICPIVAANNIVRVTLWMTGALLSFSLLAVSIRTLAASLSVFEILAVRSGIGLIVMLAIMAVRADLRRAIHTKHPFLHLLRNTLHLGGQYLWALSIVLLPLATVFSLEFTTPAWALLLAVIFLKERLTISRVGAVLLGLVGVLVIMRPGFGTFQPAMLLVVAAALGLATTLILTKRLTQTDTTFAIIFWMNAIQFPLAMLGSDPLFIGKVSGTIQWLAFFAIGFCGLASHYCLASAFRAGDAAVVVPIDFLRIPVIAIVGWLLYGERVDIFVFIGAALIVAGILWNLRSEAVRRPPGPRIAPQESVLGTE